MSDAGAATMVMRNAAVTVTIILSFISSVQAGTDGMQAKLADRVHVFAFVMALHGMLLHGYACCIR